MSLGALNKSLKIIVCDALNKQKEKSTPMNVAADAYRTRDVPRLLNNISE